jgi:hypothetical protein
MKFSALAILAVFSILALPAHAQEEGKRVALVIGNNNYTVSPLRNAINDASLMARSLQAAGFKVILKEDATLPQMEAEAAKLAEQLGPDDTALFFYAGHGVQIEGENYLVPVDFAPASSIIEAKFKCFKISALFDELKKRTKRNIIILDACRSNPVSDAHGLPSGLAQPQVSGGQTYVAFSTSPGQVAADNPAGRDSYFTEALADEIEQPGLTLDDVFIHVKSRVSTATETRQQPWTNSNLTSTFYFHAPSNLQIANDPSVAEKWMLDAQRREQRAEWDEAISLVNQVIQRKPGGVLEATANAKLPYLTLRRDAQAKYEAADYKGAAVLYEKTLTLDPFAIDAAFEAVNDYLLSDQLTEAVNLLNTIRVRGTSISVEKADAMLKELGPVYPEADRVVKAALPQPPDVQELFNGLQFGTPDWSAGIRTAQSSPVSLTRWAQALEKLYPPPAEPSTPTTDTAKVENDFLHVEVNSSSESRDISIRKVSDPNEPKGKLLLMGSLGPTAKVLANGQPKAEQLPATIELAPGTYHVQSVEKGKIIWSQDIEIVAFKVKTVSVPGNK